MQRPLSPSVVTAVTAVVVVVLSSGCGGAGAPPVEPASPGAEDAGHAAAASPAPAASASSASAAVSSPGAPASASAAAPASAATDPATPRPVASEPADECTPVGVDFEKRARPRLKECYAAGKKKDPNLEGTVKIKMTVDVKGKIKSVKVIEKTLPDRVATCMLDVVKSTPFPEVEKCWDSTLTIPMTFPTPR